ncbi:MAG: RNA methyltransferase [Pricia sp.]
MQQKKFRNQHGLFVVEGIKMVRELISSHFEVHGIFTTDASVVSDYEGEVETITEEQLRKMSGFANPNTVIGVFEIAKVERPDSDGWLLAVDTLRDPGNLGTIIRLCDWFGIEYVVCSEKTVDCYNPKTLQATMGSIARVKVGYTDLPAFLKQAELPVYGAFMEGENVYTAKMPEKGILVVGNESNGITPEVQALVSQKISIPQYGKASAESLNVASATAILLNEIRRMG